MAASSVLPHRQVVQARALLWAADGVANEEIARRCAVDSDAVRRWRNRFAEKGVDGVGAIAKGRGRRVADLTEAITVWAEHWNDDPQPFIWKATAEDIIEKVSRGRDTLHQIKSQTDH